MTASTENHSSDQKAQPTTSLPGLHEKVQPEPSTDEPEAQHDAGHDSVSSPILPSSKARSIALVATVTGATFLNTFAVQSAVIILPTIAEALDIPASRMQWIVSAYMLTFGCFLLLWGRIADLYGKRKVFIFGTAWMTLTTAANPFLPNEILFDVFRGLQGLGAAANVPTAIGILGTAFLPGKAKTYAFTVYSAGAPLGSVFGNITGGVIASFASWKWVFGAMSMLSGAVTIAALLVIPSPIQTHRQERMSARATVDWVGAFLITTSLLCLLFALTQGNVVGWSTAWVPALIILSFLLIAFFILWQRHLENKTTRTPLMKPSIFSIDRRFGVALLTNGLFNASFNGYLIFATTFYQDYQGLSPLQTTLRFIPTGVTGIVTAAIASQLLLRIPASPLLLTSAACVSVSSLLFAVPIPPRTTSYFAYGFWAMMLSTFGADMLGPCLALFTSLTLPPEHQALGGGLLFTTMQLGRAVGLAIATAVQMAVMAREKGVGIQDVREVQPWDEASLKGLRAGSWVNFAFGVTAFGLLVVGLRGLGVIGKSHFGAR
ncbi:major facilitator superfamily domain-containing protein [Diaporthe sp. PMI_573]|nr:major facilitator superfamily domain-containing protein [Diaporthaceae sp. PMI_573]